MNPEADFKFVISVEKQCNVDNDPIWKVIFDLDKKNSKGEFVSRCALRPPAGCSCGYRRAGAVPEAALRHRLSRAPKPVQALRISKHAGHPLISDVFTPTSQLDFLYRQAGKARPQEITS
jgi:hypothetical protein